MSYIVFDVETTGLPKRNVHYTEFNKWPHIVQFAWVIVDKKYNKTERSFIIKPDNYTIPQESTAIHRITNEIAHSSGIDIKQVLKTFISDCKTTNKRPHMGS